MGGHADTLSDLHLIDFGAMTCTESCIATLLHSTGRDYRYLYLDYWNLTYESGVLLAGKNLKAIDLKLSYGIRKANEEAASLDDCADWVAETDRYALLHTQASKLPYFPPGSLTFEGSGFEHYVLLHGYDKARGRFRIADPIAKYTGEISKEALTGCTPAAGRFRLWKLDCPSDAAPLPMTSQRLRRILRYNYLSGLANRQAYDRLRSVLSGLPSRSSADIARWAWLNMIAVTTVVRNRRLVWNSFASLGCLDPEQTAALGPAVQEIASLWTQFNLLLAKLMKGGIPLLDKLTAKAEAIQHAESEFLTALCEPERGVS